MDEARWLLRLIQCPPAGAVGVEKEHMREPGFYWVEEWETARPVVAEWVERAGGKWLFAGFEGPCAQVHYVLSDRLSPPSSQVGGIYHLIGCDGREADRGGRG